MKIPKPFLLLVAAFAAFGPLVAPSQARADVSVSFFYDSLDPYGEWVQTPDYGYCWHPTGVDENWAPYTDGYWAYTDSGWTWVSYEDYGGVVYHYGRWAHLPDEGWVWVPGNTWAPAWVSWRTNDDYIGWAPLPPEAHWRAGIGFSTWVDARFDIGPGFYSFVGVRDFGAPALGAVILSRDRNVTIIQNTTNITNITVNNSNVYVGGPRYDRISALTARPIPTLKLVRQGDASLVKTQGGKILSRQQGNQLVVLAPKITPTAPGAHLAPSKVAKTLTASKADHGWSVVKDPQQAEQLHAKLKQEGTDNTSAKPVNADDVKLVDQKIKSKGNGGAPNALTTGGIATSTPKLSKGKGKNKNADLLNTPATEEPGTVPAAGTTPKPGKKGKKSKTATESSYLDTTGAGGEATPIPKTPKSKKSKTPSDSETGAPYGSETPSRHSKKKSTDTNLQPFMDNGGGGTGAGLDNPTPKPKKHSEYDSGATGNSEPPKSFESRPKDETYPAAQSETPKGKKGGKGKKEDKKSSQDQPQ